MWRHRQGLERIWVLMIIRIFVLHGVINHMLNENKKLYVAFVDHTKAFGCIGRENIWYKLLIGKLNPG